MGKTLRAIFLKIRPILDIIISPLTYLAAILFYCIRLSKLNRERFTRKVLMSRGVFPIMDFYCEPLFNPKHLKKDLRKDRELPGIDLNVQEQLRLLEKFSYNEELMSFPVEKQREGQFYYLNDVFTSGDAEYLYNMIRFFKPKKIIEVGSGHSTLMAINALSKNKEEDGHYSCRHVCIEPYPVKWLHGQDIELIKEKVEDVDKKLFDDLEAHDILFIDSSHMIRPQGDVLFEYLEVLPLLKPHVLVHIHDIFTPKDYLDAWVIDDIRFWNEQYLLEAFLTFNNRVKIIGALNYLKHNHFDALAEKCPILQKESDSEPGSFWMEIK